MIGRKLVALATVVAIGASQSTLTAVDYTFDISGLEVFGDFSTEFPTDVTNFGGPGTVTEVFIDANGESFGASYNSEITFSLDADSAFVDVTGAGLVCQTLLVRLRSPRPCPLRLPRFPVKST